MFWTRLFNLLRQRTTRPFLLFRQRTTRPFLLSSWITTRPLLLSRWRTTRRLLLSRWRTTRLLLLSRRRTKLFSFGLLLSRPRGGHPLLGSKRYAISLLLPLSNKTLIPVKYCWWRTRRLEMLVVERGREG